MVKNVTNNNFFFLYQKLASFSLQKKKFDIKIKFLKIKESITKS
jgi:hypothetical protein